jgi:fatty-acid desaturase
MVAAAHEELNRRIAEAVAKGDRHDIIENQLTAKVMEMIDLIAPVFHDVFTGDTADIRVKSMHMVMDLVSITCANFVQSISMTMGQGPGEIQRATLEAFERAIFLKARNIEKQLAAGDLENVYHETYNKDFKPKPFDFRFNLNPENPNG